MAEIRVKKGDSSDIENIKHTVDGVPVTDYSNYLLNMEVLNKVDNSSAGIARTISPNGDNSGFSMALSPVDTMALGVGEYIIVADLTKTVNSVIEFNRELYWTLIVTPSIRD